MTLYEFDAMQPEEIFCGVDEAGRGPLAGPVCAAAVILPRGLELPGLNDSKKLTEKRREALFPIICEQAVAYAIAFATVEEIETHNILEATMLAMRRAVDGLSVRPQAALIDGNRPPRLAIPCRTVIHGDALSASIAAASVLAKVTRDREMLRLNEQYPDYGFAVHKGYGTKLHYARILTHGPSPVHRMSFLKKLYQPAKVSGTTAIGNAGEELAASYLKHQGYRILERNYRVPEGEIDIIAADRTHLVFCEVKTRAEHSMLPPETAVTRAKQKKLIAAAQSYLQTHDTDLQPRFDVITVVNTTPPTLTHYRSAFSGK